MYHQCNPSPEETRMLKKPIACAESYTEAMENYICCNLAYAFGALFHTCVCRCSIHVLDHCQYPFWSILHAHSVLFTTPLLANFPCLGWTSPSPAPPKNGKINREIKTPGVHGWGGYVGTGHGVTPRRRRQVMSQKSRIRTILTRTKAT